MNSCTITPKTTTMIDEALWEDLDAFASRLKEAAGEWFKDNNHLKEIIETAVRPDTLKVLSHDFKFVYSNVIHDGYNAFTGAYTDTLLYLALHLTHVDSDAFGCLATTTVLDKLYNKYAECKRNTCAPRTYYNNGIQHAIMIQSVKITYKEIQVFVPEYMSNDCILTAVVLYRYLFNAYPHRLVISDIAMSGETLGHILTVLDPPELISPVVFTDMEYRETLNKGMVFLYADHHKTNSLLKQMASTDIIYDILYHGIKSNTHSYLSILAKDISDVERRYPYIIDDNVDAHKTYRYPLIATISEVNGNPPVSATLLVYLAFRMHITDMIDKILFEYFGDDARMRQAEVTMENLDMFMQDISQWDTFTWRDYPELNHGTEKVLVYADPFYDRYKLYKRCVNYLADTVEELITTDGIWATSSIVKNPLYLYPEDVRQGKVFGEKLTESLAFKASNYSVPLNKDAIIDFIPLEELSKEQKEIVEDWKNGYSKVLPDEFRVFIYPTVGNVSIVMHEIAKQFKLQYGHSNICAFSMESNSVSFRTAEPGIDVSVLAKLFNGGGHPQASGCYNPEFADYLRKLYIIQNNGKK